MQSEKIKHNKYGRIAQNKQTHIKTLKKLN